MIKRPIVPPFLMHLMHDFLLSYEIILFYVKSESYFLHLLHSNKEKWSYMEQDTANKMTTFDSLLQTQHLQMLKVAIPYLSGSTQKALSVMTKYVELIKTIKMSHDDNSALSMCSVKSNDTTANTIQMLQEMRNYCSLSEQETIDTFLDYMQLMEVYSNNPKE